jgi:hypothetical protein
METREIVIFATQGQQTSRINTDVTTWGQLKPLLRNLNFNIDTMLATENVTRTDLVNDNAVLPSGPFRLFLRSQKPKSGAEMSRSELFVAIKKIIEKDPAAKNSFTQDGANVTRLKTPVIQALYDNYIGRNTAGAKVEAIDTVAEEVLEKVEEVQEEVPTQEVPEEVLETIEEEEKGLEEKKAPKGLVRLFLTTAILFIKANFGSSSEKTRAIKALKNLREVPSLELNACAKENWETETPSAGLNELDSLIAEAKELGL